MLQLVGESTILGVTMEFHPILQAFMKAFIPVAKLQYTVSDRLKAELRRPTEPGDPTALVAEYKHDWWNTGPTEPRVEYMLGDFEDAYHFHLLQACSILYSFLD